MKELTMRGTRWTRGGGGGKGETVVLLGIQRGRLNCFALTKGHKGEKRSTGKSRPNGGKLGDGGLRIRVKKKGKKFVGG